MVLEIKEKIDAELPETEEGSAENTFLKKLSSALPLINDSADLIKTTVELAKECGVSLDSIHRFFS
jgi:hypothetical protein